MKKDKVLADGEDVRNRRERRTKTGVAKLRSYCFLQEALLLLLLLLLCPSSSL